MLRFYAKSAALLLGVFLILAGLYVVVPANPTRHIAAVIDKERMLRTREDPALILLGGSNTAFSIDSHAIEEAFGYDVINTGVNVNLGFPFMLRLTGEHLRQGDIVVIVPEHELLDGQIVPGRALAELLAVYPGGWKYIDWSDGVDLRMLGRGVQRRLREIIDSLLEEPRVDPIYTRQGFDENGDLVTHLGEAPGSVDLQKYFRPPYELPPDTTAARLLNEFHESALSRGAEVYLTFSVYPREWIVYEEGPWLRSFDDLITIPIIARPEDYYQPLSSFFDTEYHLGAEGRALNTRRLIEDLRAVVTPDDTHTMFPSGDVEGRDERREARSGPAHPGGELPTPP